mgnify:CR=1 FL=1
MGWKAIWDRIRRPARPRVNRKRNSVASVGGRAAETAARRRRWAAGGLLAVLAALAALGVAGWGAHTVGERLLFHNPEYRLTELDIQSDGSRISADKVKQWAQIEVGMNLHQINIADKRRLLLSRVPAIRGVEIQKWLPNRLEIRISERMPIVTLGRLRTLGADQTGFVFAISPRSGASLPLIPDLFTLSPGMRLDGRARNAAEVVDVLNRTPLGSVIRVAAIEVREPEWLTLRLVDGPVVRLSWPDMAASTPESRLNMEAKLRSLAHVLEEARMNKRLLARVDMTFTDDYIPVE